MEVALEMLAESWHNPPHVAHMVETLRLMMYTRRKKLEKEAEMMFTVPAGTPFWSYTCHLPLGFYVLLPIVKYRQWQINCFFRVSIHCGKVQDFPKQGLKDSLEKETPRHVGLGGELCTLQENPEKWIRGVLWFSAKGKGCNWHARSHISEDAIMFTPRKPYQLTDWANWMRRICNRW